MKTKTLLKINLIAILVMIFSEINTIIHAEYFLSAIGALLIVLNIIVRKAVLSYHAQE